MKTLIKLKTLTLRDLLLNAVLWATPVLVIAYRTIFTLYNR